MEPATRFHLAFGVDDLATTRAFYGGLLGCTEGRSSSAWVDFDFFGHQITAHLTGRAGEEASNPVDGDDVPIPHFGAILEWDAWQALRGRLERAEVRFRIAPRVRFQGEIGEQATLFVHDPSGNALEFKSFRDPERVFAS